MDIYHILQLIGGVGLFLYGMKYLGASLEKLAGAGLEKTLEKLTGNRFKGLIMGTLVTGVIQSSAATSIMLVGFVNAGIMNLTQTIPVLMGANIGTTVTGQILRLGDISGGGSAILGMLKPSSFAPLFIGIAAFTMLLCKKKKANNIAGILMGFGILFFGMTTMETALDPLKSSESFREAFTTFTNPFVGLLLGIALAAILQSSSAAVGIVQAVAAATDNVTLAVVAPMVIGISIGKLLPIILASIGTKKEAQQVAFSQFLISAGGGMIGMIILYLILGPLGVVDWSSTMNRGNIADFNTVYNICASIILFPFCSTISGCARKVIKSSKPSKIDQELRMLDPMLLKTPSIALEQCRKVIDGMGTTVIENYGLAVDMFTKFDDKTLTLMNENEKFLDKSETLLNDYLVKLSACELHHDEQKQAAEIMHSIMDFERMGDHCIKISDVAEYNRAQKITFSENAKKELSLLNEAVSEVLRSTVASFTTDNTTLAFKVEPLREIVNLMCEEIKEHHVNRLQKGTCTVQSGISLVECLTSYERISAYCSNVALHVIERHSDEADAFDMHAYTKDLRKNSAEYTSLKAEFEEKYFKKLEAHSK
ncbi:MAG: Na/Pi cotransporter family protein [Lachnospiraceae bacterium]|nr:Na/Pi cotransporter family protein [Lachnospiraceae bacterium]